MAMTYNYDAPMPEIQLAFFRRIFVLLRKNKIIQIAIIQTD